MRILETVSGCHAGPSRKINEDAVLSLPDVPLFAIADGTGGLGSGDYASKAALDVVSAYRDVLARGARWVQRDRSTENRLALAKTVDRVFTDANRSVHGLAIERRNPRLGSTMLVATVIRNFAYIAHVGDCRAYLLRDGHLARLTEDHSVAELRLRRGRISQEEYETSPERQVLYQLLGAGVDVEVDLAEARLAGGDVLMLCSDGLVRAMPEPKIAKLIRPADLDASLDRLISAANRAKAPDNVSVVLVSLQGEPGDEPIDTVGETLRNVFLFRDMTKQELMVIAPYLEEVVSEAGRTLVSEGDAGDTFYVVVSGKVRVTRGAMKLADIGEGGHFGEMSLARPVERSATVRSLTPVRMFALTRRRFHDLCLAKPAIGSRLAIALLDAVGERARDLADRLETVDLAMRGDLKR